MPQVLIIHGWSDTSKSFVELAQFLERNGYATVPVWLGDYISLDDDVGVQDVAKRLQAVVEGMLQDGRLTKPFDAIVHSTGGLVIREWVTAYYGNNIGSCPLKRVVMLAPANFGSRLAQLGQSMVGRLIKGWRNWFHTGKTMLGQLELASGYLWELALRDLFIPPGQASAPAIFGADGIWPAVIVGTHPYTDNLRRIVNENGSDGTVRVSAANLNAKGITIDFAANEEKPVITEWKLRSDEPIPFAVLPDRTHGSITNPDSTDVKASPATHDMLGQLILAALGCKSIEDYRKLAVDWQTISDSTADLADNAARRQSVFGNDDEDPETFHQFFNVFTHVVDDHGSEVFDYFLEFMSPNEDRGTDASVYFHREVLKDVHTNGANAARRCLYADRTDLMESYYSKIRGKAEKVLNMSISANPPGDNVTYFDNFREGAKGTVPVHQLEDEAKRWLQRNRTHLVRIVIPRCPKDQVFRLSQAPALSA